MIRKLHTALLFVLLCGGYLPLAAQQYGYVQYNTAAGAPFDRVSTVLQDPAGFLWIGSENGLYRFDGVEFEIFSLHTQSQDIHQLRRAGEDLLFVNDQHIYQIDHLPARPAVNRVGEEDALEADSPLHYPNNLVSDPDGSI